MLRRRDVIAAAAATAATSAAHSTFLGWPSSEELRLWPGLPPGSPLQHPVYVAKPEWGELHVRGVFSPKLDIFRPTRPDGRALLICPGGGYEFLSVENEGLAAARRFCPEGITVCVLSYRLPGEGWHLRADVPLQDAQRAVRLLRARAARLQIDPARIGVIGFSAGGHVAATLATDHAQQVYAAVDDADRLSARPALVGLMYPVISMIGDHVHAGSRDHLVGTNADEAVLRRRTAYLHVDRQTPPCFIAHAVDDTLVPVGNSLDMFAACRAANNSTEAHFFASGGHGFGFHAPSADNAAFWPDLFLRWSKPLFART